MAPLSPALRPRPPIAETQDAPADASTPSDPAHLDLPVVKTPTLEYYLSYWANRILANDPDVTDPVDNAVLLEALFFELPNDHSLFQYSYYRSYSDSVTVFNAFEVSSTLLLQGAGSDDWMIAGAFDTDMQLIQAPPEGTISAQIPGFVMHGGGGGDFMSGGLGGDDIFGGAGGDVVLGLSGADYLKSGAGDDSVRGGADDDTIEGGLGRDLLEGADGDDHVRGGGDPDALYGGGGDDILFGGRGDDRLLGGPGGDVLSGGQDQDALFGQAGADVLLGKNGDDHLSGGDGADTVFGGHGRDTIFGDGGDDLLRGGAGPDKLYGGVGNDTLIGGAGNDVLFGGPGADTFLFKDGHDWDMIQTFEPGDQILVAQSLLGPDGVPVIEDNGYRVTIFLPASSIYVLDGTLEDITDGFVTF